MPRRRVGRSRLVALALSLAVAPFAVSAPSATAQDQAQVQNHVDTDAEAKERDIVRAAGQPWLRINPPGHTAAIQSIVFSPDSRRLYSAGLDNVVQVWDLSVLPVGARTRDLKRTFLRERAIRWQVSRGPRGSLFALAVAPDGTLAMGGYGAMGSTGEILLVNPVDGSLIKVLEGHRQTICSLAFSSDGATLVSIDTDGECRFWQAGPWTSQIVVQKDAITFGPARAALVQRQPLLRPLAVVKDAHVIVPVPRPPANGQNLQWQLQEFSLETGKVTRTFATMHLGVVTCVAVDSAGEQMASADLAGNVYFQNLAAGDEPRRLPKGLPAKSLAFSPGGETLALGTATSTSAGTSQLQFWDVATLKMSSSRALPDHVQACAYSADGKYFGYTGGPKNEVFVERLAQPAKAPIPLAGGSRKIRRVAFAATQPFYRIAFAVDQPAPQPPAGGKADSGKLAESFDSTRGQLQQSGALRDADWLPTNWSAGNWRAQVSTDTSSIQLSEGTAKRGLVQLNPQTQGFVRSTCWIPGPGGKPFAIAVGTNKQNLVCVYRLAAQGACPLLRQFRGHQDLVTSVAVSRDLKLLVSGSADGTIQFWSLSDYENGLTTGRWGAGFQVAGGKRRVQAISEAGPLFAKGLRAGDTIREIRWRDGEQDRSESAPQKIADRLRDLPWFTQIEFDTLRASGVPLKFQLVPAWPALASLYVSDDREWAFWTPEGYYDASANGHTLFGWQVNRGLQALPNFYRADQFRRKLERPDVLQQLLTAGSLDAALRIARQAAAEQPEEILPNQIAATPTISILSPSPGAKVENRTVKVRARVTMPADGKISESRVFANGVVARANQLVSQEEDKQRGIVELVYEWDAVLPRDARNMIQVYVLTQAGTTAFDRVFVEQPELAPVVHPKLYVLALGVNDYKDPDIEDLDYSVADATALVSAIEREAGGLYDLIPPIVLTDAGVTRDQCRATFAELGEKLRDTAGPDDVLVIFIAGHGEVDPGDQTYHYMCHDARIDSLFDGRGSITWNDFQPLADIPCRKVALLDTCHSGAIHGSRLKNNLAARDFQENLLLTLTAAADNEASQERTEWRHGAFTKVLLDGLAGSADSTRDGLIMLDELVDYAHETVPSLTGDFQHPTAAPRELMEFIALPLAEDAPASR
jgi:WD40 repeat protein